jgi:hypothetical protein
MMCIVNIMISICFSKRQGNEFDSHMKVPLWSRIGRLKRQVYPKLTGGGHNFGGGASHGVMSAVAGRLLCDTYLIGEGKARERGLP